MGSTAPILLHSRLVSVYPASIRWQTWHEAFRWEDWRLVIYGQDPFWLHANGWWESAYVLNGLEQQDLLRFYLDCDVSPTTVAEVRCGRHPIPGMTVYEYWHESVHISDTNLGTLVFDTWYHEADVAAGTR